MYKKLDRECTELSQVYFTKEFPGFEIESKWKLLTENPVPTLLRMRSDVQNGAWQCYEVSTSMGKLPVGIRFFNLRFQFWGVEKNEGMEQVAMVACIPSKDKYQLAFKSRQQQPLKSLIPISNPPLLRPESRTGKWISNTEVVKEIQKVHPGAKMVGEIMRQKCFTYITSRQSYRNYSISADLCHHKDKSLSQVEIEYKGRRGCWLPDMTGVQIVQDFTEIHLILEKLYGAIITPTSQTKFDWITGA